MIRVFTRNQDRVATENVISSFNQLLLSTAVPDTHLGDIDKSKLPGLEVLNETGKSDGQVKMVRVGGMVEAHEWSDSKASWTKIGEVVDAVGNQRKKMHAGKEYDFVFDVDIADGAPPLKLPYNIGGTYVFFMYS